MFKNPLIYSLWVFLSLTALNVVSILYGLVSSKPLNDQDHLIGSVAPVVFFIFTILITLTVFLLAASFILVKRLLKRKAVINYYFKK